MEERILEGGGEFPLPAAEQIIGALARTFQPESALLISPRPARMAAALRAAAPKAALCVLTGGSGALRALKEGDPDRLIPEEGSPEEVLGRRSEPADFMALDGRTPNAAGLIPLLFAALSEGGFWAVWGETSPEWEKIREALSDHPVLICETLEAGVILCMKKRPTRTISTQ